ncbi:MAG: glycosyltransferase family 1 protein, partial [Acidimicrobiales bacterium]
MSRLPALLLTRAWHAGILPAPGGFDVVHAGSFQAPRSTAPLTVAVHDLAWRVVPETFPVRGRRWHDAALAKSFCRATRLLVPSAHAADQLRGAGAGA